VTGSIATDMRTPVTMLLSMAALAGCGGWTPAKFADRPPVTVVHDDVPIAVPDKTVFIEELYQADVYVRREIVNRLDPRRPPGALDVNSLDEVPRSSWYRGTEDSNRPLLGYVRDGPPQPPFTILDEEATQPDSIRIRDARGLSYELLHDPEDRPGMRTAAAAITSRLVYALGYHTPEVYVILDHERRRAAATRWPIGRDLGPTPVNRRREDDPNDHLPHVDRRSLRVMKIVAAWLGITELEPRMLRDVYLGERGQGHVEHELTGLDGALGVRAFQDAVAFARDPDRESGDFAFKLFSLGLSPKPPGIMPQTPWPSVGLFHENVAPDKYRLSPPFEPTDRLTPGDAHWIAKRIGGLPLTAIADALAAGKLQPAPTNWLFQVLHLRRAQITAWGYDRVTPLELVTLTTAEEGAASLVLADVAVAAGVAKEERRSYDVSFHDLTGRDVAPGRRLRPRRSLLAVILPKALRDHPYVVVRIRGRSGKGALPRSVEIHLLSGDEGFRVIAIRH